MKEYANRPEVKARRKAWLKKYYKRPQFEAMWKEYIQRPEVKAHRIEWEKEYRHKPGVIELSKKRVNKYYKKTRVIALNHYGHKCACCGETGYEFLTFDHVNNDGKKHREQIKVSSFPLWLIRNNFPLEPKIQILCWNCQEAKAHYGHCPHEKELKKL